MKIKYSILIICLLFQSCSNNKSLEVISGEVELYLLESFDNISGTNQINEATVVLTEKPLIPYADFISYNSENSVFKVTDNIKQIFDNTEYDGHGKAFGIVADGELIYAGYFWATYSSMGINSIVIDPLRIRFGKELRVKLGYPGQIEGSIIPDNRNDKRILDIFRRDNKLID